MLNMEKVTDVNNKEIKTYLEVLRNYLTDFEDVCKTEYMDKTCIVTHSSNGFVGISEYDEGFINPYVVSFDEGFIDSYTSEGFAYKFGRDENNNIIYVQRLNFLNYNIDQLALITYPNISYLSYVQINGQKNTSFSMLYDVTNHDSDIINAINCSRLHKPFIIEFKELKPILKRFFINKCKTYALQDDLYEKVISHKNGRIVTVPYFSHIPDEILKNMREFGFLTNIPEDIISFVTNSNDEFKKVEDITSSYKKVLEDKKC